MSKHKNSGACAKCHEIMYRFGGLYPELGNWFVTLQRNVPTAHISEAGRGEDMQNALFLKKATRARWGHSAHNFNAALDIFELDTPGDLYNKQWYEENLKPHLASWLEWYGEPGSSFYELPHVEIRGWKELVQKGLLKLVG